MAIQAKESYLAELRKHLATTEAELAALQAEADVQQTQARATWEKLVLLSTKVAARQTDVLVQLEPVKQMPVVVANVAQAHTICCLILGFELDYEVFTAHELDGASMLACSDSDLVRLFDLQPVGHRHRLLFCLRQLAHAANPAIFAMDFEAGTLALASALAERGVSPELVALVLKAKIDSHTCGTLTTDELGSAHVSLKARLQLLAHIHEAGQGLGPKPAGVLWDKERQQAVLDDVLTDNPSLAALLAGQDLTFQEAQRSLDATGGEYCKR